MYEETSSGRSSDVRSFTVIYFDQRELLLLRRTVANKRGEIPNQIKPIRRARSGYLKTHTSSLKLCDTSIKVGDRADSNAAIVV